MVDYPIAAYGLDVANIGTVGSIPQIMSSELDPGLQLLLGSSQGDFLPTYSGVVAEKPLVRFQTHQVAAAITLAGNAGLAIPAGGGSDQPVTLYVSQRDAFGRKVGSAHTKLVINDGLFLLTRIEAVDSRPAVATLELHVTHDGSANDQIIVTADQALPASVAVSHHYLIGSAWINGDRLDLISRIAINMGYGVVRLPSASTTGDRGAFINKRFPTVDITTTQGRVLSDFGTKGKAMSGVNRVHFAKSVPGAGIAPDIGAGNDVHIRGTMWAGLITNRPLTLGDERFGQFNMRFSMQDDGSNGALTLAEPVFIQST